MEKAKAKLNTFLRYWQKQNYKGCYNICQKTWKKNHSLREFKALFANVILSAYDIISQTQTGACATFNCLLTVNNKSYQNKINVIAEKKAYKPDPKGEYGVNPISAIIKHELSDDIRKQIIGKL